MCVTGLKYVRLFKPDYSCHIPCHRDADHMSTISYDILVDEDSEITCKDRNPLLPTKVDGKKNLRATQNFRVTPQSLQVLHTAAESFLVNVFQVSKGL